MVSAKSIVAYGLALLPALATSSPVVPRHFQGKLFTRSNVTASQVEAELGPQLSSGSLIFGPESADFASATRRWNTFVRPTVQVVVEPASESDIAHIVSRHSGSYRDCDNSISNSSQYRSGTAMRIASSSSCGTVDMERPLPCQPSLALKSTWSSFKA